jgi:hypothetical protein
MKPIDQLSDDELMHLVQRATRLPDAPAFCVQAAIALWPDTPRSQAQSLLQVARSALHLVTAVLSFDSWSQPPVAMGMRGSGSDTRHLLFSTPGGDVDLHVAAVAEHFAISGQLLGRDEGGRVELTPSSGLAEGPPTSMTLDELGEFRLEGLAAGSYRLSLRLSQEVIVLPVIDIGQRPH